MGLTKIINSFTGVTAKLFLAPNLRGGNVDFVTFWVLGLWYNKSRNSEVTG